MWRFIDFWKIIKEHIFCAASKSTEFQNVSIIVRGLKISSPFHSRKHFQATKEKPQSSESFQEVIFLNRSYDSLFYDFPQHFTSRKFDKLVAILIAHDVLHVRVEACNFNEGIFFYFLSFDEEIKNAVIIESELFKCERNFLSIRRTFHPQIKRIPQHSQYIFNQLFFSHRASL